MTTYYVSTSGSDASAGTLEAPFATLQKGHDVANAGDTIYMRGGTYSLSVQTTISRSGSSGNHIKVFNYPGEVPVLDAASNGNTPGHSVILMKNLSGGVSWWHLKGLELKNSPGYGIYVYSGNSNIIIELCNVHHNLRLDNSGGGLNINNVSDILVLNNDSHHNGHAASEGGSGINLDYSPGSGNVIRGNRIWRNNDNGVALWDSVDVLVENNWVWENGYDDDLVHTEPGDGIGLKLGGGGAGDGGHTVRNNLVWKNYSNGFDDNAADNPMSVYNNTAWSNANTGGTSNFAYYSAVAHVLKNNLALTPNTVSFHANVLHTFNSWNLGVTVSTADFVSIDFSGASGARQADGSLPVLNFLKLVAGSDLIDVGTNVGIAYSGSAPDLGAYEYAARPPRSMHKFRRRRAA